MSKAGGHPPGGLLLLQPAFLGDVVLSTALLESWHRTHPGEPVRVWVRRGAEGFFEEHPFVTEVFVWDRSGVGKYRRMFALAQRARRCKPDVVVNLHRFASMSLVASIVGAPSNSAFEGVSGWGRRVICHPHGIGDGRHETERNHAHIAAWVGAFRPDLDRPRLHPSGRHQAAASIHAQGSVVLAPSSIWATKRWPEKHWSELVNVLHDQGEQVLLLGGPLDEALLHNIANGARKSPVVVAGQLDLLGSAALMSKAKALVSNDSAPLHMAGAVGTPVVGVFCSTTSRFGFGALPGDLGSGKGKNVELGEAELACKPCGLHGRGRCPLDHFQCGHNVGVEAVRAALTEVSSLPAGGPDS